MQESLQGVIARSHCKKLLQRAIARSHCKERAIAGVIALQGVVARSQCKESLQGVIQGVIRVIASCAWQVASARSQVQVASARSQAQAAVRGVKRSCKCKELSASCKSKESSAIDWREVDDTTRKSTSAARATLCGDGAVEVQKTMFFCDYTRLSQY